MVNCLHYLYQWGEIKPEELYSNDKLKRLFWCEPDTGYPLRNRGIIEEDNEGNIKPSMGVYNLIDMVEGQLKSMPNPDYAFGYPISNSIRQPGQLRPAFLAISYASEFESIKERVIKAANMANFQCEVSGDLSTPGNIMEQVWQGIRGADVVIADITGNNPNVFYEIGLAHALGKEVVLLSQEVSPPFDILSSRLLVYDRGNLDILENELVKSFYSVSSRYPFEGDEPKF